MRAFRAFPVSALLGLATLMSTGMSALGGFYMYLENLDLIFRTVEDVAKAESFVSVQTLNDTFTVVAAVAEDRATLLKNWRGFGTHAELVDFFLADAFARVKVSPCVYGAGLVVAPHDIPGSNGDEGLRTSMWWDPLVDPAYIDRFNGSRAFYATKYLPEYRDWECLNDAYAELDGHCVHMWSMRSDNGALLTNEINYTVESIRENMPGGEWYEYTMAHGGSTWWGPSVWLSPDGTLYLYGGFTLAVNPVPGSHHLAGKFVVHTAFISFYMWQQALTSIEGLTGDVFAATAHLGAASPVIATSYEEEFFNNSCTDTVGSHLEDCLRLLKDLEPMHRDAAIVLKDAPVKTFLRESVGGTECFLWREEIFGHTDLPMIYLFWVRPTSDVREDAQRSLISFCLFIAAVLLFDCVILLVEVRKIGTPLGRMAGAVRKLDSMDTEAASSILKQVNTKGFQIAEILVLHGSLVHSTTVLQLYKEFLPQSCLQQGDVEEASGPENDGESTEASPKSAAQRSVSVSECSSRLSDRRNDVRMSAHERLLAGPEKLLISMVVANVVGFHQLNADVRTAKGRAVLESMLVVVKLQRGTVDDFIGDRCRMSWNTAKPDFRHRVHAAQAAEQLQRHPQCGKTSGAVVCGEAHCGFDGCEGFRYFTTVGPVVSFAFVLERAARAAAAGSSCWLCSSAIHRDVCTFLILRWHARVVYPKLSKIPATVWQILEEKATMRQSAPVEEWMYAISRAEQTDVWAAYNEAMQLCESGDLNAALRVVTDEAVGESGHSDRHRRSALSLEELRCYAELRRRVGAAIHSSAVNPAGAQLLEDISLQYLTPAKQECPAPVSQTQCEEVP
eukprot:TRINITY_DN1344_c0_g1_i4.p1 TRINITY_DN1344_c0_g1~~TRINITY_DN1344_c0_g1_i4.p1  ORF type:complete len:845 (+),score=186.12 TRINITY_DN1344_c0_g1_i4:70-2604(+)